MHIAVSTASLSADTLTALQRAADLGFRTVEINLQPEEFGYGYRRKTNARFYRTIKHRIDELGLQVWSTTTPPLSQLQMFSQRARREMLLSSAIAAGLLGSKVFVAHYADIFSDEEQAEAYLSGAAAPPIINGYDEAWVQAVNRRTMLAVRNSDDWIGAPLVNRPERMAKLTSDLAIGWAMDLRAALKRAPLAEWLAQNGDRLAVAYAHDVADDRACPPVSADWAPWLDALGQTRLKCLVIHAPNAGDDELRAAAERLLSPLPSASPTPPVTAAVSAAAAEDGS